MYKQLLIFCIMVVLGVSVGVPRVEAASIQDALERMDAIIAEMQSLRAEFASLISVTTSGTPVPAVLGSVTSSMLGNDLRFGSTNNDIKKIQALLATDPTIYPYGVASGYFGPKTQAAVRLFQSRFNLDTVGVVGPSTKALLEVFLAAYPDGNYPVDVLKDSLPKPKSSIAQSVSTESSAASFRSILVSEDNDEYIVRSYNSVGKRQRDLVFYPEDEDDLISMIATKLSISESEVRSLVDSEDFAFDKKRSNSSNADDGDAKEAIDNADDAIDRARDRILTASRGDDDIEDADDLYDAARVLYKSARKAFSNEDYDTAVDDAEEAQYLAEDAVDAIGGGSSRSNNTDIDSIEVTINEDDSDVDVAYENGDNDRFTVEETDIEDIISEIADEIDIDEGDVEDVVEFDYGSIKDIYVQVDTSSSRVTINFESGLRLRFTVNEDDEEDIISEISDRLDVRESVIERDIEFG